MIEKLSSLLGLPSEAVALYERILIDGAATGGELARVSGLARATTYDLLGRLVDQGLVKQSLFRGVKRYTAEPAHVLSTILDKKIAELQQAKQNVELLIPLLEAKRAQHFVAPRFQLFEGPDAIQNLLNDMLLFRDIDTRSFWPISASMDALSADFFKRHNRQRIENNISVKAIWPQDRMVDTTVHPYLGSGPMHRRQIRIAPLEMDFAMGYWIYGSRIAFLSSKSESVGFIIESREMVDMMSVQHDLIWKLSTPIDMFLQNRR